ncbi:hypothetical protein HOY34_11270 [Xinfangfangia sp. D13-10-4-6]|uniref:hypothetical protein n=1 Tax=Pseudogemmobacter hezensis TaxID=2737662 RepID=UPI001557AF64|nr:hypothetical protein [Pseudogemmobacter hezensis]NPD15782.1 hypothetical protein [Pseudogemmobacter hezensis]
MTKARLSSAKIAISALLVSLMGASSAAASDPAGTYSVDGLNPGGESGYTGTVTVKPTGQTFAVTWEVEGHTMEGTAVVAHVQPLVLSVAFGSGDSYGVAVLQAQADETWVGTWALHGESVYGAEVWTPQ